MRTKHRAWHDERDRRRRPVRVLVVEDETQLADAIARGLRQEGMAVDIAGDGSDALQKSARCYYDVILLDRDIPGTHGDEVCRTLSATGEQGRILMLTASHHLSARVEGLNLGADDYLGKPFAFAELVARVRALARRSQPAVAPLLARGDLVVDPARRLATRDGMRLDLSRKELAVLEALLAADGAVVSAESLLERVWDENADPFTNAVRVTMSKLRRKLGDPPVIVTVTGSGYAIP
jgi:DNA-binding response OmpR family regulator